MHSNETLPLDAPLDVRCGYALKITAKSLIILQFEFD